jgi:TRAP-type C4-dicarboxylate transport system substrate-binding protein
MLSQAFKCVIALSIALAATVSQADVVIKLATVAPKDSIWHMHLKKIDQRWQQASNGEVRLRIYAGTLGDEDDILRRVRVGQLDAAAISTAGLSSIDRATQAMHIPLAFISNEEMEYVRNGVAEQLESVLAAKGFRVLTWAEVGWVHFFTRDPVATPDDLRKQKLFVWSNGDSANSEKLWQSLGFNTISLSSIDIMPALQTGMITAFQAPPLMALANQWFPFTPYMTDLKWAPLTGATVITEKAWQKIPERLRPELARIVDEEAPNLQKDVRDLEQQAKDAMVKRGLKIVAVDRAAMDQWLQAVKAGYPRIRGTIVPEKYFAATLKLRDEYRALNLQAVK